MPSFSESVGFVPGATRTIIFFEPISVRLLSDNLELVCMMKSLADALIDNVDNLKSLNESHIDALVYPDIHA
jgi:hypothetical protein